MPMHIKKSKLKMTNQLPPLDGNSNPNPLHFVLVPLMAQGHMIPMVDMARLLAGRGATVTFVTTPLNAARIKPIIDHISESHLPIHFLTLRFPCVEAGLPEGTENADTLPSRDLAKNFYDATRMLHDPLVHHLRSKTSPHPTCIISDFCHPWAQHVALEFNIPRIIFHGFSAFALLCRHNIELHGILDSPEDKNEPFVVPGLPERIKITRAQSPGFPRRPSLIQHMEDMREAEEAADGVVVNSFDDLEPSYIELYQKAIGKKAWTIGPMWLYNRDVADLAVRGDKASIDETRCLRWLDGWATGSVIYVSFGSLARTAPAQLMEIGVGLEASGFPFVWVIKAGDKFEEVEAWLLEGFEERTKERGLIIRGWASQVMILSHRAVGGFMTHCGWNSTLEAVSAGVPLITWPHCAEQFLNERMVVDVLRVGVPVGVEGVTMWGEAHSEAVVKRDGVEMVVRKLMERGGEGDEIRERVRDLEKAAREAMEEGGSSHANLSHLMEHISNWADNKEGN